MKIGRCSIAWAVTIWTLSGAVHAQFDPGARGGAAGAGGPLPGLTPSELAFFNAGRADFNEQEAIDEGLGPRFNLDSCGGCHLQPDVGGSSPPSNPQAAIPSLFPANTLPSFIRPDGPVREARFKSQPGGGRDGGVHALFVITGAAGATNCNIRQEDFGQQLSNGNVIFRIPTPTFGLGLIEEISDSTILANLGANGGAKAQRGIVGRVNRNGNDGRVARFGWKAQNPSGLVFGGEAYNVEMGITNEAFPIERDETASCQFATVPNDTTNVDGVAGPDTISAIEKFSFFMRFLAPPAPSATTPGGPQSIARGAAAFNFVGCALCHTPTLRTGNASVAALRNKSVNLYSDLALHNMGPGLADDVSQGAASGDEFRTAPLWGLGQRLFFLHDGRATNLLAAIGAHRSGGNSQYPPSEANSVVASFNGLPPSTKQDVLNFLRSL
jgi:CxxC motif-containing protein (DUF1111 family)